VIAFIFADLIVLPILNIYRKYYGLKMAGFLSLLSTSPWQFAALIVDLSSAPSLLSRRSTKLRWWEPPSPGITPAG